LEILAIPCNDFGAQEPGTNAEVVAFARSKGGNFPVTGKIDCWKGADTHPLYVFLTNALNDADGTSNLKWNFAKFLCDADGIPVKRYSPKTNPLSFETDITAFL